MLHFPRWKVILVSCVVIAGILFALPNMFAKSTMAEMPRWLPHQQVNLGLDLQGGAHLLYQLDEQEMVQDWLNSFRDDVRETLRKDRVPYTDLRQDNNANTVSVKIREGGDYDKAYTEIKKLSVPVTGAFGGISGINNVDVTKGPDNTIVLKTTEA